MFRLPEEAWLPFRRAEPPHIVVDEFCTDPVLLHAVAAELHAAPPEAWERGELCKRMPPATTPPATMRVLAELLADEFVARLRALTTLEVVGDGWLFEAGAQAIDAAGIPLHADFNVPTTMDMCHRLCLLLFVEPGPPFALVRGSEVRRVTPAFNRAVIFAVDDRTLYTRMPGTPTVGVCTRYYTLDRPLHERTPHRATALFVGRSP